MGKIRFAAISIAVSMAAMSGAAADMPAPLQAAAAANPQLRAALADPTVRARVETAFADPTVQAKLRAAAANPTARAALHRRFAAGTFARSMRPDTAARPLPHLLRRADVDAGKAAVARTRIATAVRTEITAVVDLVGDTLVRPVAPGDTAPVVRIETPPVAYAFTDPTGALILSGPGRATSGALVSGATRGTAAPRFPSGGNSGLW